MSGFGGAQSRTKHFGYSKAKSWRSLAITLDQEGERFKGFLENNSHLQIEAFQAIKGTDISQKEMVSNGLVTDNLACSPLLTAGALGCAASHRAVWIEAAQGSKGYFVLEDDCYTHPKIVDFIAVNLKRIMAADICFFGINTDSILQGVSPAGLTSVSLFDPKHPSQEWIQNAFLKTTIDKVEMHRLIKAFGTCAYFVSPGGARKMIDAIFPLSLETTYIPLITDRMPAISIDRAGCCRYSQLDALICQPFLAYSPNSDSTTKE